MTLTYTNNIRIIRAGSVNPATELNLGNGKAIQMLGTGDHVEQQLRTRAGK